MTETTHPLSAKVLNSIDPFNTDGAVASIVEQFSIDSVFVVPGHSAVAGSYRGRDGVREFFERIFRLGGGNMKFAPIEVIANDERMVLFLSYRGTRGDHSLDVTIAGFHSNNSPEGWGHATFLPDDQAAFDRFFQDESTSA